MIAEAVITFREALEAALIVGIMLAYLEKTKNTGFNRHVYLGVAGGLLVSIIVAFLFQILVGGFEGFFEQVFEGILMVFAAFMVAWMIFWMMGQKHISQEIEDKVAFEITSGQAMGLALFTFISVLREGVETVIFISAAATKGEGASILGMFAGVTLAVILAFIIFETAVKINLKRFFNITSFILILFAAGILAHGIHEFQEAGILPEGQELWSTKNILDDEGNVGGILRALVGYNDNPTLIEVMAWLGYILSLPIIYLFIKSRVKKTPAKDR